MPKLITITLILLLCINANAQKVKDCGEYKLIYHDSIPLAYVDSLLLFGGEKHAVATMYGERAYVAALSPVLPMRGRSKSAYEIRNELTFDKITNTYDYSNVKCFKISNGFVQYCINYEVLINGDTVIIDSPDKFREIFAPVDNVQEAIAFACLFTDSKPIYNLDFLMPKGDKYHHYTIYELDSITGKIDTVRRSIEMVQETEWIVYLPEITSSYVKKTDDAYELLLYHYRVFGCNHPYKERHIKVYTDGRVEILKEQDAFERAAEVGFCVD